ncbi:hypothetical protein Esti_006056 [Eimeria stiedai]
MGIPQWGNSSSSSRTAEPVARSNGGEEDKTDQQTELQQMRRVRARDAARWERLGPPYQELAWREASPRDFPAPNQPPPPHERRQSSRASRRRHLPTKPGGAQNTVIVYRCRANLAARKSSTSAGTLNVTSLNQSRASGTPSFLLELSKMEFHGSSRSPNGASAEAGTCGGKNLPRWLTDADPNLKALRFDDQHRLGAVKHYLTDRAREFWLNMFNMTEKAPERQPQEWEEFKQLTTRRFKTRDVVSAVCALYNIKSRGDLNKFDEEFSDVMHQGAPIPKDEARQAHVLPLGRCFTSSFSGICSRG